MMTKIFAALALCLALVAPQAQASGTGHFSIGASTGTNLVVISIAASSRGPAQQPVQASAGVVCGKSSASSETLIYTAP
jgi:hypothetical protein